MFAVAIADDHLLFTKSLKLLIDSLPGFQVVFQVSNGQELIDRLSNRSKLPDIVLLDINMPTVNGIETMQWIQEHLPTLKVLALSMDDEEETVITMLRFGAKGYVLKDSDPSQLHKAMLDVLQHGFHHSEMVNMALLNNLNQGNDDTLRLNDREVEFLQLVCTERTYKEIAELMFLSPKTIDGYRENLFKKLGVKSRVGLVVFAIKNGLFKM